MTTGTSRRRRIGVDCGGKIDIGRISVGNRGRRISAGCR